MPIVVDEDFRSALPNANLVEVGDPQQETHQGVRLAPCRYDELIRAYVAATGDALEFTERPDLLRRPDPRWLDAHLSVVICRGDRRFGPASLDEPLEADDVVRLRMLLC